MLIGGRRDRRGELINRASGDKHLRDTAFDRAVEVGMGFIRFIG
jgi:hypothetical protein